jgi:phosphoglycolate phosphatase-like HAD superfamily hydrolase
LRDFLPLFGRSAGSDDELDHLFRDGYLPAYRRAWTGYDDVDDGLTRLGDQGLDLALLTNAHRGGHSS